MTPPKPLPGPQEPAPPGVRAGQQPQVNVGVVEVVIREALRTKMRQFADAADAHRLPWTIFGRANDTPVTVGDLLRETADGIARGGGRHS